MGSSQMSMLGYQTGVQVSERKEGQEWSLGATIISNFSVLQAATFPASLGISILHLRQLILVVKSYRSDSGASATISSFVNFLGGSSSLRTLGVRLMFIRRGWEVFL